MDYQVKNLGQHRGAPRLFFQTQRLAGAGLTKGQRYSVDQHGAAVTLRVDAAGARVVSGKEMNGKVVPVIDLNSSGLLAPFDGMQAVKVTFGEGELRIQPLASEANAAERLGRVKSKVATGLTVAALAFGGGILDHAAHAGMVQAGIPTTLAVANEIDDHLLEHAAAHNPVVTPTTTLISAPMQELIQDEEAMAQLPRTELLIAGIPCSGASKAGKSKHSITMMEAHPEVGHLAHAFLCVMQRVQPAVVLLENVPEYADSASAQILRQQMRDMGYTTHEVVLDAQDFGALEKRVRWFLVAATRGIQVNLDDLAPPARPVRTVAQVLDADSLSKRWGSFDYLKAKAERDLADGKGFKMQTVSERSTSVPTLRKGYHKGGSTDPLLLHPTDPNLMRLFTGDEHARIKGVDPKLVAGLSNTDKHIVLGQGVAPGPVTALARRIGECIKGSLGAVTAPTTAGYRLDRAVG